MAPHRHTYTRLGFTLHGQKAQHYWRWIYTDGAKGLAFILIWVYISTSSLKLSVIPFKWSPGCETAASRCECAFHWRRRAMCSARQTPDPVRAQLELSFSYAKDSRLNRKKKDILQNVDSSWKSQSATPDALGRFPKRQVITHYTYMRVHACCIKCLSFISSLFIAAQRAREPWVEHVSVVQRISCA